MAFIGHFNFGKRREEACNASPLHRHKTQTYILFTIDNMTIKIEREALQCITNDVPVCSPLDESINQVDHIPEARFKEDQLPFPEMELTDDDDSSVSSYSFSSASSGERRVSWSDSLVTDIRTRERTRPEDVSLLFYSYEETQR